MLTAVISLIILVIAFFLISAVIFCPSYTMKKKAVVFIPLKKCDIDSIETDVRTFMKNLNKDKIRDKVYLVNLDDDTGVFKICRFLCREYDMLEICSEKDIMKILQE